VDVTTSSLQTELFSSQCHFLRKKLSKKNLRILYTKHLGLTLLNNVVDDIVGSTSVTGNPKLSLLTAFYWRILCPLLLLVLALLLVLLLLLTLSTTPAPTPAPAVATPTCFHTLPFLLSFLFPFLFPFRCSCSHSSLLLLPFPLPSHSSNRKLLKLVEHRIRDVGLVAKL
jgi:hypothetical protein